MVLVNHICDTVKVVVADMFKVEPWTRLQFTAKDSHTWAQLESRESFYSFAILYKSNTS